MIKRDIKALAVKIIEKYGTNNPFILAESIGLVILYHMLPDTLDAYRLDNLVVINLNLSLKKRKWVLAHEIGHYFIHGTEATLGNYLNNTLQVKPKMEREADIFASELLLAEVDKPMIEGLTSEQLAIIYSIPEQYIKYKFMDGDGCDCCNI